jgi:hypothetical protein
MVQFHSGTPINNRTFNIFAACYMLCESSVHCTVKLSVKLKKTVDD